MRDQASGGGQEHSARRTPYVRRGQRAAKLGSKQQGRRSAAHQKPHALWFRHAQPSQQAGSGSGRMSGSCRVPVTYGGQRLTVKDGNNAAHRASAARASLEPRALRSYWWPAVPPPSTAAKQGGHCDPAAPPTVIVARRSVVVPVACAARAQERCALNTRGAERMASACAAQLASTPLGPSPALIQCMR